jgi:hypothetical protein
MVAPIHIVPHSRPITYTDYIIAKPAQQSRQALCPPNESENIASKTSSSIDGRDSFGLRRRPIGISALHGRV